MTITNYKEGLRKWEQEGELGTLSPKKNWYSVSQEEVGICGKDANYAYHRNLMFIN